MKGYEQGFSLLELLASIALNSIIVVSGAALIANLANGFVASMANWEMLEEVRQAAHLISDNMRYAHDVEIGNSKIVLRGMETTSGGESVVTYSLQNTGIASKIFVNGQPMTGDSELGNIDISRFKFERKGEYLVHMLIEGRNRINGHTFSVESDILLYSAAMLKNNEK